MLNHSTSQKNNNFQVSGGLLALALFVSLWGPSSYAQQGMDMTTTGGAAPSVALPQNNAAVPGLPPEDKTANILPVQAPQPQTAKSTADIELPSPPPPASITLNASQLNAEAAQANAKAQEEAEKLRREQEHIKQSFERAAGGLLPLSTEQIHDFMRRYEESQEASQLPSTGAPKAAVRIVTLSLDPGAEPPQINLQMGYVTTINIMDATGEPWPILDVGIGGGFEVSPTQAGSHVVRIMPLAATGLGNLSVLLKDLPTPVIFKLAAGNGAVDMRYDARIPKFGPGAKVPLIKKPGITAGDEKIMMILQNLPPDGAERVKVAGLDARTMAWALGDKVYLRTPLTLLSPAWNASVSSNDGMTVYEIGTAPVLLLSDGGALLRAKLLRDEDHDR